MKIQRLVFPESSKCVVEEVELDEKLEADEVLLKTKRTLISAGTELSLFTRTHRGIDEPAHKWAKYPFKAGYLAISEVVAGSLPAGTRVFSSGYHATYSKDKAANVVPVPKGLNDEHAAFFGLARIAMTAPRLAPARLGGNVVVIGLGIVGNLCAQIYRLSGAVVMGVDLSEKRLEKATACGLPKVFCTAQKPLSECVKEFGKRGAETIIEAVGNSRAINDALKCVANRGNVVLLGSPRTKMEIDPYYDIHCKGISVIGAHGNHYPAAQQAEDAPLLMDWLRTGSLCVAPLITQHLNFREALAGYEGLRDKPDQYVGVVLTY